MRHHHHPFVRACALLWTAYCLTAEVRLPAVLADHMVVQRGQPVHVWGFADPGEAVSVAFRGESRTGQADSMGRWSVYLPPGEAGGPFELTVKGSGAAIILRDVLVGDVWVGSGQSNMEWTVEQTDNAAAEIAKANYPKIRLFHVKNRSSEYPLEDVDADSWAASSPATAAKFSAVAYYFGRELHERNPQVPIGLIATSWGGTPAEAWTSLPALARDASLMPVFAEWGKMMDGHNDSLQRREKQLKEWDAAVAKAKAEGKTPPGRPWAPNLEQSFRPAGLYNAMIAPLTRFPIRGAIWYQGESNASIDRAPLYERLFQTMIRDWRKAWGGGDFPFLFVQLANFKTGPTARWPELREAQTKALSLANTGMAVTIDIGDPNDIHPRNKQDVGARLARWARAMVYGEAVETSGPLFQRAAPEGMAMRVWFDHAAGLQARGGGPLQGFEVAGADRKFVSASEARIEGPTVVVSNPQAVPRPLFVRYAWADNPLCNLYNAAGLPASPFRSGE